MLRELANTTKVLAALKVTSSKPQTKEKAQKEW